MRAYFLAMAASSLAVGGCVPAGGLLGGDSPTSGEVLAAIRLVVPRPVINIAEVNNCREAEYDEQRVQFCDFCTVYLEYKRLGPTGGVIAADTFVLRTSVGSAAFARAISYSQPNMKPTGGGGVWVVKGAPSFEQIESMPIPAEAIGVSFEIWDGPPYNPVSDRPLVVAPGTVPTTGPRDVMGRLPFPEVMTESQMVAQIEATDLSTITNHYPVDCSAD